jgi:hypothetical protein
MSGGEKESSRFIGELRDPIPVSRRHKSSHGKTGFKIISPFGTIQPASSVWKCNSASLNNYPFTHHFMIEIYFLI